MSITAFGLAALIAAAAIPAIPSQRAPAEPPARVAITVDDLPVFPELPPGPQALAITRRLLAGFRRAHWLVTGFVNEGQLEDHPRAGRAVLKAWVAAGYDLGNHTYSHASLSVTPAAAFIKDIARGDRITRPLLAAHGKQETWFRYPYLATGRTPADRRRVETWLAAHHYRIAPVSLANMDWEFAEPYDDALKHGNRARAAIIRDAYLIFTRQILAWTRHSTLALLGHEPAYVLLLHASRLNADVGAPLAAIVAEAGLRPIPLKEAATDPAYRLPDPYVGTDGPPALERWAYAMGKPLSKAGQPQVPADIAEDYRRVEAADPDARTPITQEKKR